MRRAESSAPELTGAGDPFLERLGACSVLAFCVLLPTGWFEAAFAWVLR